jgi:DNA-binding NtrC family response regulator
MTPNVCASNPLSQPRQSRTSATSGESMESQSVVLYQNDPMTAQTLAVSLAKHFNSVYLARNREEVLPAVARHRAEAVVLDLETAGPGEVERLHQEFPALCIVGTHRLADDKLWAEAMSLGASDICEPRNADVVRSLLQRLAVAA